MIRHIVTINEAAHEWVREWNTFPVGMIEDLMRDRWEEWEEITEPAVGDRVVVNEEGHEGEEGEIVSKDEGGDEAGYLVELDAGFLIGTNEVSVIREDILPMWGWMWQFSNPFDVYWVEEGDGVRVLSDCGYRVIRSDSWGIFFGIDGAGYDFYGAHHEPLYLKRGLRWHDVDRNGNKIDWYED